MILFGILFFIVWEVISVTFANYYAVALGIILFLMLTCACSTLTLEQREKENWKTFSDRWHIRAFENSNNRKYKGDISSFIFYEEPINEYPSVWNTWKTLRKYNKKRYY